MPYSSSDPSCSALRADDLGVLGQLVDLRVALPCPLEPRYPSRGHLGAGHVELAENPRVAQLVEGRIRYGGVVQVQRQDTVEELLISHRGDQVVGDGGPTQVQCGDLVYLLKVIARFLP